MKIIVNAHEIKIEKKEIVNKGEYKVQKCIFEFSQEYALLTKYAIFTNCNGSYKQLIVNNQCDIPIEVLQEQGNCELGVYGYETQEEELIIRYSPKPSFFSIVNGSYISDAINSVTPTPSDLEQLQMLVTNNKNDIENIKAKNVVYDEDITQIKSDIESISDEIETINNEQTTQNENITNNTNSITEINGEISAINNNIGVLNQNVQDIDNNLISINQELISQGQDLSGAINDIQSEITNRENADINLQEQIDGIVASSDVKDIVGTYQELLDYDTTKLGNNDIVKVLQDNTHDDAMTYYKWSTNTNTFTYIGQEGPYYTKSEIDTTLQPYVKNTDYATSSKGGVIKYGNSYGTTVLANGVLGGVTRTYEQYEDGSSYMLIGKGTLENIKNNYVKDGLVNNNIALTDEEQLKIEAWLGLDQNYLTYYNQTPYQVNSDYNPAHKKYVDGKVEEINVDQARQDSEISKIISVLPKKTSTGTSTLSYNNAKEFDLLGAEYQGNVEQETTTGKNLLPVVLTSITINGITATRDKEGFINVSGTATDTTIIPLSSENEDITFPSTVYLQYENDFSTAQAQLTFNNGKDYVGGLTFSGLNRIYDMSSQIGGKKATYIYFYVQSGATINGRFRPMLHTQSTIQPYEPPIGITPRPDYPQEVKTLKGWNLFDLDTDNIINGYLQENGIRSYATNRVIYIPINGGETYTIQKNVGLANIRMGYTTNIPVIGDQPILEYADGKISPYTSKAPTNANYLVITVYRDADSSYSVEEVLKGLQIVKATTPKPCLPYGAIGVRRIGKNLIGLENKQYLVDLKAGDKITIKNNSSVQINVQFFTNYGDTTRNDYWTVPANSYRGVTVAYDTKAIKCVTDLGGGIIYIYRGLYSATEIPPYEPYQERIDYIDLQGNEVLTTDKIKINNGRVKLVKNWGKVVLDGSESWSLSNSGTENYFYALRRTINFPINERGHLLSSHYLETLKAQIGNTNTYDGISLIAGSTQWYIRIRYGSEMTIEQFKQWLSQNKPEVYYVLATPQEIDLGEIDIQTLEGTNNVEILAILEPTAMSETYVNDVNKEIEELKQALLSTGANI